MADVTESSLNLAAHEVVADFNKREIPLNEGVIKKASELGLNRDQTCRLIERTNSEAFLSLFPEKTEFAVADPNVIFSNAETINKIASVSNNTSVHPTSYTKQLERSAHEIFGIEESKEKVASELMLKTPDEIFAERIEAAALIDDINMEKTALLLDMEEADTNLWNVFRDAALSGEKVANMERELVLSYPEKTAAVCSIVSEMVEKLASVTLLPVESYDRLQVEDINVKEVCKPSKLTEAFDKVLSYDPAL